MATKNHTCILLVDDEPDLLHLMELTLIKMGLDTERASVRPAAWYSLQSLDDEAAIELLNLLTTYNKAKIEMAAKKQGLVTSIR